MMRGLVMIGAASLMLASAASAQEAKSSTTAREVWIAIRADGQTGTGSVIDPVDGGTVERLNALFDKFKKEYGDNLTMHFGPGVFYGDRSWEPKNNWKIRGAGMDITVFKTKPDPDKIETVGFRAGGYTDGVSGFELSDCTFDFNTPHLRKANRGFLVPEGNAPWASHFFAKDLPAWSPDKEYRHGEAVAHKGTEYIQVSGSAAKKGQEPVAGPDWSVLRPNRAEQLPAWKNSQAYGAGEAVAKDGSAYLCLTPDTASDPAADGKRWQKLNPDAPDPMIYTSAAFVHVPPPGGRNRVSRVKAINGHGSAFFGREDFIIGLGGNDCVIEDCVVDEFQGDYGSLIVLTFGQHGVIRGCSVRGNDGRCTIAYGGWACWETVFENNFSANCHHAVNIDSLTCRNVTFQNNVFMNCSYVGILANIGGNLCEGHTNYFISIDGQSNNIGRTKMDGLFIHNNLVEMRDGAPFGGIQVQQDGLRNVRVANNAIRTTSGAGKARAIGVCGQAATNVTVCNNTCESGMYSDVTPATVCRDNYDLSGQPMKDSKGQPIDKKAGP